MTRQPEREPNVPPLTAKDNHPDKELYGETWDDNGSSRASHEERHGK
jgi:hypothetical protein